jgi:hypothetical protein
MSWIQADPAYRFEPDAAWDQPRRANLYAFEGQNPLRYIDADGRDFADVLARIGTGISEAGAIAGAIGTGVVGGAVVGVYCAFNCGSGDESPERMDPTAADRGGPPGVGCGAGCSISAQAGAAAGVALASGLSNRGRRARAWGEKIIEWIAKKWGDPEIPEARVVPKGTGTRYPASPGGETQQLPEPSSEPQQGEPGGGADPNGGSEPSGGGEHFLDIAPTTQGYTHTGRSLPWGHAPADANKNGEVTDAEEAAWMKWENARGDRPQ